MTPGLKAFLWLSCKNGLGIGNSASYPPGSRANSSIYLAGWLAGLNNVAPVVSLEQCWAHSKPSSVLTLM